MSLSGMVEISRPFNPAQDRLQSERTLVMPVKAASMIACAAKPNKTWV